MYDLIKKINTSSKSLDSLKFSESKTESIEERSSAYHKSIRSNKSRKIIKERVNIMLTKLKAEINAKIEKVESKFDEIVLENSESSESSLEDRMGDWGKLSFDGKFEENKKLGRTPLMASKKHSLVRKRPNELIDEKLPE